MVLFNERATASLRARSAPQPELGESVPLQNLNPIFVLVVSRLAFDSV